VARGWDKGWDFLKILGWDLSRGAAEFFLKKVQGRRRGASGWFIEKCASSIAVRQI
jgi:hypothetical protein